MAKIMTERSIGRLGHTDEVAAAVLRLCGPEAGLMVGVAPLSVAASPLTGLTPSHTLTNGAGPPRTTGTAHLGRSAGLLMSCRHIFHRN